jgi:spermidine synthase
MFLDPHRSSSKIQFLSACILLGFSSIVAQIVLFREMMVSFYGNELSLGVMLSVWLFWVGIGSAAANRIARRRSHSPTRLWLWYLLISVASPATVILIRCSKQILGTAPAEIVGFIPMFLFALGAMSILCLCLGITFVLNSGSWKHDESRVFSVNRVYLWESVGAGLGGFLVTFILIPQFSNFQIVLFLFCLNLLFCAILVSPSLKPWARALTYSTVILLMIGLPALRLDDSLDRFSAGLMWRGLSLAHSEDTRYGNIAVTEQHEQITFYQNGLMLFSYPDAFSAEEAVHFALLEHPHPQSLLLIGGGMGGALSEALKYDGLTIDYVEIDPELIRAGEGYLPEEEVRALRDSRVNIHFLDGRLFVQQRGRDPNAKSYDLVILNLPDPYTAQLNRFFTLEFFRMVKSVLKEQGIFSFRVSSAENYISEELGLYLSSIHRTLSLSFEEVKVLPGSNSIFLASGAGGSLFDDWRALVARLEERGISTQFVNENFLPERLSPLRVMFLKEAISAKESRTNYDLNPICYFYNSILWSKQFGSLERSVLLFLSRVRARWLIGALGSAFFLLLLFLMLFRSRRANLTLGAILVAGFTGIFVEIMVVLSFQIFYGYVYSMIGLVFTLFMLGLALGALIMQKRAEKGKIGFRDLSWVQFLGVILVLSLLITTQVLSTISPSESAVTAVLLLLITASGLLGGVQFVLANHLFLKQGSRLKAGTGYAVDLLGASFGALLSSALLVPVLGIPSTLIALLLVNLICLGYLLVFSRAA